MVIPQHVAIILDGNGRWAKSKGMPRNYGHVRGAKNLETICRDAWNIGIKYLTVYLFSTENWKRSKEEVDALMDLFRSYTKTCKATARKNNMKVRVLGEPSALSEDLQKSLRELEESSKDNTGLNFQIAINYGRRAPDGYWHGTVWKGKWSRKRLMKLCFRIIWIPERCRTRICSYEPAGSSGFLIICSGSLPIRNFILQKFPGRHLRKKNSGKPLKNIMEESAGTEA